MNRFLSVFFALVSTLFFVSCGTEDGPGAVAKGTYMTTRVTYMVGLPPSIPYTPLTENNRKVVIKAKNENVVSVTLPSTTYAFNGMDMVIPSFTIDNVPVLDDTEGGACTVDGHAFSASVGNKDVQGTLELEVEADGDMELDITFTYGSMPFALRQKYEGK